MIAYCNMHCRVYPQFDLKSAIPLKFSLQINHEEYVHGNREVLFLDVSYIHHYNVDGVTE